MNTAITLTIESRMLVYSVLVCIVVWLPYVLTAIWHFRLSYCQKLVTQVSGVKFKDGEKLTERAA